MKAILSKGTGNDALSYEDALIYAGNLLRAHRITLLTPNDIVHESYLDGGLTRKNICRIFVSTTNSTIREKYYDENGYHKSKEQRFKTCKKCLDLKPVTAFRQILDKRKSLWYPFFICYECEPGYRIDQMRKWRVNNKKQWKNIQKKAAKKYYEANRHTTAFRATKKRNDQNYYMRVSADLTDTYIKIVLRSNGIKNKDITPAMIRKKRKEIKQYRERKPAKSNPGS